MTKKRVALMLSSIFLLLSLTACSTSVTSDNWNKIIPTMSVEEVTTTIGEPKSESTNNDNILENVYAEKKDMEELNSVIPEESLQSKIEALEIVYNAAQNDESVKEAVYSVKTNDGKHDYKIYYVNGSVVFVNFLVSE